MVFLVIRIQGMNQKLRNASRARHGRAGLLAALLVCAGWIPASQAAEAGHSRLVSAPGAPLQAVVPIRGMTAEEAATLRAVVAPESAWIENRMAPPVPLSGLSLRIEPGASAGQRVLRIYADQPPVNPVVDLLLDVTTSSGQRRMQVSFMATRAGLPTQAAPVVAQAQPARGAPAAASGDATAQVQAPRGSVTVRRGDTLSGIAARNGVDGTSLFQMLVALWRANPDAFLQNNMNLVLAGATLVLPDAATVRAIDPDEARRIYLQQVEAFNRGRGAGAGVGAAQSADPASGQVGAGDSAPAAPAAAGGDRVRLSAAQQAQDDERASLDAATRDTGRRVDQLQSNVDGLNRAVGPQGAGTAGDGTSGGAGGAAAGNGSAAGAGGSAAGGGAAAGNGSAASGGGNAAGGGAAAGNGSAAGSGGTAAGSGAAAGNGSTAGAGGTAAGGGAAAGNDSAAGANGTAAGNGSAAGANGTAAGSGSVAGSGGAAGTPGAGAAAGAGGTATGSGTAAGNGSVAGSGGTPGAAGSAPAATPGGSGSATPGVFDAPAGASGDTSGRPPPEGGRSVKGWLNDNLLVIVTGFLAIIAFIIAWAMRRAGARRDDDRYDDDDYDDDAPRPMDDAQQAAFNDKLERIDLSLDDNRRPDGRQR